MLPLADCGKSSPPIIIGAPTPPPPPANIWQFQFSPGLVAPAPYGNGGFIFQFPATDGAHNLVRGYTAPVARLAIRYTVTVSDPAVVWNHNPDSCGPATGGTIGLYIQAAGDLFLLNDPNGRWFTWPIHKNLEAGSFSIDAPTRDNEIWTNVAGKKQSEMGFSLSAMVPQAVGVTFGGGCAAGHGTWVTGGTATISADFEIN